MFQKAKGNSGSQYNLKLQNNLACQVIFCQCFYEFVQIEYESMSMFYDQVEKIKKAHFMDTIAHPADRLLLYNFSTKAGRFGASISQITSIVVILRNKNENLKEDRLIVLRIDILTTLTFFYEINIYRQTPNRKNN